MTQKTDLNVFDGFGALRREPSGRSGPNSRFGRTVGARSSAKPGDDRKSTARQRFDPVAGHRISLAAAGAASRSSLRFTCGGKSRDSGAWHESSKLWKP